MFYKSFDDLTDEDMIKDVKSIKKSIKVESDDLGVNVIAVAKSVDPERNAILEIPISGEPLNCEVHDVVKDAYHVEGVDYYVIGSVPINYHLTIDDAPWRVDIPLPVSVVKRYLTDSECRAFNQWKLKYNSSDYRIEYLQVLNVY